MIPRAVVLRFACWCPGHGDAMTSAAVRVGMLGAGFVARRHVDRMRSLTGVEVVGVADPQRERAEALAGECGARTVDDVHQLVDLGLDALYVCVPPHQHGEPEDTALAAGLPMFLEKPLAGDLTTAEELDDRITEAGLLVSVGYQWRYLDTLQTVSQRLEAAPARMVLGAWLDKAPAAPWWSDQAASGGQVVEQLTHVVDMARVIAGEVESLTSYGARDPLGPGDIQHVTASSVRFRGGAVGTFASSCLLTAPYRIAIEVVAPGVALRLTERDLTIADAEGQRTVQASVDPILEANRAFLAAVRGEGTPDIRTPYAEALRTHRLACALSAAALGGDAVRPS